MHHGPKWPKIVVVEAERDITMAAPVADDADVAKVVLLARLGGIGTEPATVLVREALYRPFASGDRHREQGISKAGNPLLRKSMVELAWLWLRYQRDTTLARWFIGRFGKVRDRIR
jgi:transposase